MIKTYLFATLALLLICSTNAQTVFADYNWDENAVMPAVPDNYKQKGEIVLERHYKIEVAVDGSNVQQFYLMHDKTFINSDEAVERNNRVYVPFGRNESVIANKLRVRLNNGKTIALQASDILEEIDEEKGMRYHYYAINGLEKGAVIEKFYILREVPELDGRTIRLQEESPVLKTSLELIYPPHLEFRHKSYNGLPEAVVDTTLYAGKHTLHIQHRDVPGMDFDEKYANAARHMQKFRYKLQANLHSGAQNLYGFKEFASNIYGRFHPQHDKKDIQAIAAFCKDIRKSDQLQDYLWNIENKIKKTITYDRYADAKGSLANIIKAKQANQSELLLLYLAVFDHLGIDRQIVLTSNRFRLPFDPEFESYENLSELLFYFPDVDKYMSPTEIEYRIPLFPEQLGHTNGLFIRKREFGGVATGIGEIRFINLPGSENTKDFTDITVDFTKDIEAPTITSKMTYNGYSAQNLQPIKDFAPAGQYQAILKQIAENYIGEADYNTLTTENDGLENIGKKPFVLNINYNASHLMQKAGSNYLFQLGQIIGRQMELYQEVERALPVEIEYPRAYVRTITLLLPQNVSAKNLDKINMSHQTVISGNKVAAFESAYKTENQKIIIHNTEFYNAIDYPLEVFPSYKEVINAAADFNKLVLVLSKS